MPWTDNEHNFKTDIPEYVDHTYHAMAPDETRETFGINDEGDDATALKSIADLFESSRSSMRQHGVDCANTGTLLTAFLNQKVRSFTAKRHKQSVEEKWIEDQGAKHPEFRTDLKELQPVLRTLAKVLSHLADAKL